MRLTNKKAFYARYGAIYAVAIKLIIGGFSYKFISELCIIVINIRE
jgi:hypothetical protein